MSLFKDIFIEEYDRLVSEAEEAGEAGEVVDEEKLSDKAVEAAREIFWGMCDEAKDRAKYKQ
jgi:hypothetical protein